MPMRNPNKITVPKGGTVDVDIFRIEQVCITRPLKGGINIKVIVGMYDEPIAEDEEGNEFTYFNLLHRQSIEIVDPNEVAAIMDSITDGNSFDTEITELFYRYLQLQGTIPAQAVRD